MSRLDLDPGGSLLSPENPSFLADSGQKGGNRRFMPLAYPKTHQRKQNAEKPWCRRFLNRLSRRRSQGHPPPN